MRRTNWIGFPIAALCCLAAHAATSIDEKAADPKRGDAVPTKAIATATNGVLTVQYDNVTGMFTIFTGTAHPSPGRSVLYPLGTSYLTFRDATALQMHHNRCGSSPAAGLAGYSVASMCTPAISTIGSTGFRAVYTLPQWTVTQEVRVNGTVLADTNVSQSVTVTNTSGATRGYGLRYLWDWMIASNDASYFRPRNPDGAYSSTFVSYDQPQFQLFEEVDAVSAPTFNIFGTVGGGPLVPAPTRPDQLRYAAWFAGVANAWDFNNTGSGSDSATAHYWGYPTARTLGPAQSATFVQYITTQYSAAGGTAPTLPTPSFPITVTSNITPTVANATAVFQARPQDVGTTQNVYVFSVAPRAIVQMTPAQMAAQKADPGDPLPCVLAQLNSSGRLQYIAELTNLSSTALQAAIRQILSAQGNSITLLDNVSTPNVAGTSQCTGYGASAESMLHNGVNRCVLTVPGPVECRPQPPRTGWWWNPAEGGRGFSLEVQGGNMFMATYLYDNDGRASWLVAQGPASLEGTYFNAEMYSATGGVTLYGDYRPFALSGPLRIALAFNTSSRGTLVWPGGTLAIERFPIAPGGLSAAPLPGQPESGWWWNSAEPGRGFFIEWQGASAMIAGYMYEQPGNAIWYIASIATPDPRSMNGMWWQFSNGQTMTGAWRAAALSNNSVGEVTIRFTSATTATMTLPSGRVIALVRYRFSQ